VCGVDIIQSIIILVSSYFIIDFLKQRKVEEGKKIGADDEDKLFECLEVQIKRLAIFYLVFAFFDLMLLGIGNIIDNN